LWRYHADGKGKGVRTKLTTSAAAPDSDRPVQVVINRAEGFDTVRHVFYRQPRSDNIWYAQDGFPDGAAGKLSVRQLEADGEPVQVMKTFGLVTLADGLLLVGAAPHLKTSLRIVSIPWAALEDATWMEGVRTRTVQLPLAGDSGQGSLNENDCEVCCDVILPPGQGDPQLVVIAKRKDTGRDGTIWRLGCWLAPIGDELMVGELVEHPQRWTGKAIRFPKIQVLPDNSALAYYLDDDGRACWFTNTAVGLLGYTDPADPSVTIAPKYWLEGWDSADALSVVEQMSRGKNKAVHYGDNASQLVIRPGKLTETPGRNNPELTDAELPLYAGLLYYNGNGQIAEVWSSRLWRTLQRTARPRVAGRQLLVGIIEGPPPIPNENLNMDDKYDPLRYFNGPGYSQAVFAGSQSEESGFDLSWSAAAIATMSIKGTSESSLPGILSLKAWLKAEVSLSAAYKGALSRLGTTQSVSTITAGSEIEGDGVTQKFSVQPAGVLVFQNADWTGYQYSYRTPQGTVADGSVSVFDIEPTNVSVEAVPYLMNPEVDPVPGKLSSYVLSRHEHEALERKSKIDLGQGTGYLTGAWGYDTKTVATFGMTKSETVKHGFKFNAEVLLSAGMEGKLLGNAVEGTAGVGLEFELESSWSTKNSEGITVGSEVWLRGNSEAPDAYTSYTYRVYLLEESSTWATDLRAALLTPTWPENPAERLQQQRLLELIDPQSQPWKLCYSVSDTAFTPAVTVSDHRSVTSA
jgi:hypothetical protein